MRCLQSPQSLIYASHRQLFPLTRQVGWNITRTPTPDATALDCILKFSPQEYS